MMERVQESEKGRREKGREREGEGMERADDFLFDWVFPVMILAMKMVLGMCRYNLNYQQFESFFDAYLMTISRAGYDLFCLMRSLVTL